MENCSWVVVQKIYYYSIIKLILSPPCLAGGHCSQDETAELCSFCGQKPSYSIVQPETGYGACSSYF